MARMYNPPHPGEVLREFLPDGMTIEEVARRLGVSRVQLSRVLNGRSAISADMAIRIGLLTNTTPESWLAGQTKRDLWQASQKPRPAVEPFKNGRNQALRIPREFELAGNEAILRKEGDRLIIEPVQHRSLRVLLATWEPIEEDFPKIEDLPPEPVDI